MFESRNPSLKNSELLSLDLNHPLGDVLHDHYRDHDEQPSLECPYCWKIFPSAQSLGGHQKAHRRERFAAKKQLLKLSRPTQNEIIRSAKARGIIASSSSSNTSASVPKSFNYKLLPPPPPSLGRYKPPALLKFKLAHWPFHRFESSPSVGVGGDRPVEGYSKFLQKKTTKPTAEKSPHPPAADRTLGLNPPPEGELMGSDPVSAMEVGSTLNGAGEGRIPRGLDLSLKL